MDPMALTHRMRDKAEKTTYTLRFPSAMLGAAAELQNGRVPGCIERRIGSSSGSGRYCIDEGGRRGCRYDYGTVISHKQL